MSKMNPQYTSCDDNNVQLTFSAHKHNDSHQIVGDVISISMTLEPASAGFSFFGDATLDAASVAG